MLRRLGWGLSAGLALAAASPAQELTLRTVQQANSIVKYDPEGAPQRAGLCMDVLRAVERADPGLRFVGVEQVIPLKRVERLLAEGQIDVFFCLLRSPERERQWRYVPVPLYGLRHVVAQRMDDPRNIDSLLELATMSQVRPVLVTRGSVLGRKLETIGVNLAEVGSEREALQMLVLGRTDAVYGQDINLARHMRDAHLTDRVRLGRTAFQDDAQFLAVRSDLPAATIERLTDTLRKLERDGVLRLLSEKYR